MVVVTTSATVVVATAVTVFDGVIEIRDQYLLYGQGWCSSMYFDTQLGKHLYCNSDSMPPLSYFCI